MNVLTEGCGVVVNIGGGGGLGEQNEKARRVALERLDDGGHLLGPSEVIVVNELGWGGVVQREIEAESGVVEEEVGGGGWLRETLKFTEHEDFAETRPADG